MTGLKDSTAAEFESYVRAGCESVSPAEYEARVVALGYRLERAPEATGAYTNSSNGRTYRAYGVSYSVVAVGGEYGRVGRRTSFANVDADRSRLAELQQLRQDCVVFSGGRLWEL
jgi:hypothetical protein